jgi:hypothetical protein
MDALTIDAASFLKLDEIKKNLELELNRLPRPSSSQ